MATVTCDPFDVSACCQQCSDPCPALLAMVSRSGTYHADVSAIPETHCHGNCTQDNYPADVSVTPGGAQTNLDQWGGYAIDPVSGGPCARVVIDYACITSDGQIGGACTGLPHPAFPYIQWFLEIQPLNDGTCPGGVQFLDFCKAGGTTPAGTYTDSTNTITIT